jgi:YbbR domain-containing protein
MTSRVSKWVPSFLQEDLPRKLVALFLALLVWGAVKRQLRESKLFQDIPVFITSSDEMWVWEDVASVDLKVRGSLQRLNELRSSDFSITAEVPTVARSVKQHTLRLRPQDNVDLPSGVKVVQISPDVLRVQVDRIVSKQVPVELVQSGKLGNSYEIANWNTVPKNVTIKGPERVLEDIASVKTEPIFLDENVTEDFEIEKVQLQSINRVSIVPPSVEVRVFVERVMKLRALNELPVQFLAPSDMPFRVVMGGDDTVDLVISGKAEILESLTKEDLRPFVDLTRLAFDKGKVWKREVQIHIHKNADIRIDHIYPKEVAFELKKIEASKRDDETSAEEGEMTNGEQ